MRDTGEHGTDVKVNKCEACECEMSMQDYDLNLCETCYWDYVVIPYLRDCDE